MAVEPRPEARPKDSRPKLIEGAETIMPGKRVQIDDETWTALQMLARDSMKDFQDLAEEAFADLLKKHHRPATLKDALRQSVRAIPANDQGSRKKRR